MKYWQVLLFLFLGSSLVTTLFASGLVKVEFKRQEVVEPLSGTEPLPAFFDESKREPVPVNSGESVRVLGEQVTEAPVKQGRVFTSTYTAPTAYPTVNDWYPTSSPAPKDVSIYLDRMKDLFGKIADLNGSAELSVGMMGVAAESLEPCSRDTWSQEFLANGEPNPNFVFDPSVADDLYQSCLDTNSEIVNMWAPDTEAIKGQIDSYHDQIVDIKDECNDSQCNEFYWAFVNEWQASGWYVR